MNSLIAENVSCSYGKTKIVSDVSMEIAPFKITALLGGSGAGKSTLLRLFAGLEGLDSGKILLGSSVFSQKGKTIPSERRRIGLVFQDFALFPHLTSEQNICFGLNHLSRNEAREIAAIWLERMELLERKSAYPHQLSGGEQQRVAIARALAPEPNAILMDEPFSGLDPALRESVRALALKAVKEAGIPALLVTHDAEEAMAFADHLAVMRNGKIIQQDAPENLYSKPVDYLTAAALGPLNKIDQASSLAKLLGANSGVRREAIRLDPDGPVRGVVQSVQRVGADEVLKIYIEGHGTLVARTRHSGVSINDAVKISFDPRFCFRFEGTAGE